MVDYIYIIENWSSSFPVDLTVNNRQLGYKL